MLLMEEYSKAKGKARAGSVVVDDEEPEPQPEVKVEQTGPTTPATSKPSGSGRARKAPAK